jgi:hypothetical protein
MHTVIEPKIMYFGTSVVLISTLNEERHLQSRSDVIGLVVKPVLYVRNEQQVLNCPKLDPNERMRTKFAVDGSYSRCRRVDATDGQQSCT